MKTGDSRTTFAHMGDDHHCLPQKRNIAVAWPSCASCSEHKQKNEFRAPFHRFSLNFCFRLHSPSEIRTLLFWLVCLVCLCVGLVVFWLVSEETCSGSRNRALALLECQGVQKETSLRGGRQHPSQQALFVCLCLTA